MNVLIPRLPPNQIIVLPPGTKGMHHRNEHDDIIELIQKYDQVSIVSTYQKYGTIS